MYNDFRQNFPEIFAIMRKTYQEDSWSDESRPRFLALRPFSRKSKNSVNRSARKTLYSKKRHILESEVFNIQKSKTLLLRFFGSQESWKTKIKDIGTLYVFRCPTKRFRENKIEILEWQAVIHFETGEFNGFAGFTANHAMARLCGDTWAIDKALGQGISLYDMHRQIFFAWGKDAKKPRNHVRTICTPNGYDKVW